MIGGADRPRVGAVTAGAERPGAPVSAVTILAAIGLALVAQWLTVGNRESWIGWTLYALAAALAAAATWNLPQPFVPAAPAGHSKVRQRLVRALTGAGAAAALGVTTALAAGDRWRVVSVVLWIGGFVLATVAVRGWRVAPAARGVPRWSSPEIWGFAAIVAVGAVLRVLWIDEIPRYVFGDEPRVGISLVREFREGAPNFFKMSWNTWPMIGIALQGVFIPVLGWGSTVLRLSSALSGTLAVAMTYLLARHLYSRQVAVLAAVLFAVGRTAVDFSRMGICHAQVMFFETFALFWWWRAINTGLAGSYLWAGIGLGLCLYTYNAGQSVPFLLLGWLGLASIFRPGAALPRWRGVAITVAGFLLAAFPWVFYVTDHFAFTENWRMYTHMARNRQVATLIAEAWARSGWDGALEVVGRQAGLTWLGFGVIPGGAYQMGYRGGGMLDHVTAPLFVLGLGASLPWLRGRGGFVPYWWLLLFVLGGVLTNDPPAVVRLVGILPALALLAALPLDAALRAVRPYGRAALAGYALAGVLLAGATWDNWRTYFVAFPAEPIDEISELVRLVQKVPRETPVVILGVENFLRVEREEIFALDFPDRRLEQTIEPAHLLPVHRPVDGPIVLVVGPTQLSWVPLIREWYPNAKVREVRWPNNGRLLFPVIEIPAEDVRARTGLTATAADAGGAAVKGVVADPFGAAAPLRPRDGVLRWGGRIYWPSDRPVTVRVRSAEPLTMRIGAGGPIRVAEGSEAAAQLTLARGWQLIVIEERLTGVRDLTVTLDDGQTPPRRVTRWELRPDEGIEGLRAKFTRDGETLLRTIEPQINLHADEGCWNDLRVLSVVKPFAATLDGALRIARPGEYELEMYSTEPYEVRLDGEPLCASETARGEDPVICKVKRSLAEGDHPLELRWTVPKSQTSARRVLQMYWTPPDGTRELVPPSAFVPKS